MGKDFSSISVVGWSCATSSLSRSMLDQKSAGGKLHLKWYQHLIFRYTPVFALEQTMCSCGSWHTLWIFQLELFLEKKFSDFLYGARQPFSNSFLEEGGCFIRFKKRPYKEALFIKIAGFFSSIFKNWFLFNFWWDFSSPGVWPIVCKSRFSFDFIAGGYVWETRKHEEPKIWQSQSPQGQGSATQCEKCRYLGLGSWVRIFLVGFIAGPKLPYIHFMKIDFGSKVCSQSKLHLKSVQNVILR